ncbi:hypothetical protein SAXN108_2245 [Staphylococcus aureus]|nr:hypothetical protein SAXN108_2245 [Staphylococcus aureus]
MDNGSCNDFKKISINFESVETIEELAKSYFNWRTSTKNTNQFMTDYFQLVQKDMMNLFYIVIN